MFYLKLSCFYSLLSNKALHRSLVLITSFILQVLRYSDHIKIIHLTIILQVKKTLDKRLVLTLPVIKSSGHYYFYFTGKLVPTHSHLCYSLFKISSTRTPERNSSRIFEGYPSNCLNINITNLTYMSFPLHAFIVIILMSQS